MFEAIIFSLLACGMIPRCSLDADDGGEIRLEKIVGIIRTCGLGIHDISRTEPEPLTGLPRFNMPFELGLFLGCTRFSNTKETAACLIFDREPHRFQTFLSDISGQDIHYHAGDPRVAIAEIRRWLRANVTRDLPGGAAIWNSYLQFRNDLPAICRTLRLHPNEATFADLVAITRVWLTRSKNIRPRILYIDDDEDLCLLVSEFLRQEGFDVRCEYDGAKGLEQALARKHDFILLDVMLPSMEGFEVLRRLRRVSRVPVLMLTARGQDLDRIAGLELGADDYLAKPFNPRELFARIRAILRRYEPQGGEEDTISFGGLRLDRAAREVCHCGTTIPLNAAECRMLDVLMRNPGQVISRIELFDALRQVQQMTERTLSLHVTALRRKLGNSTVSLITIPRHGYMLQACQD
jgi:DNA-binding response OmpR family regulator